VKGRPVAPAHANLRFAHFNKEAYVEVTLACAAASQPAHIALK
jgi:hypothetical protein